VAAIATLIIGQGLAGTALAWQLRERQSPFLVLDDPHPETASRVAAGLVTPVTGQALRARPGFAADLAHCRALYKSAEKTTARSFWREQPALRLLDTPKAVARAEAAHAHDATLFAMGGALPAGFSPVPGLATMPLAARLDVPVYLEASAGQFARDGQLRHGRIGARDLEVCGDEVRIDALDIRASHVVWCGGAQDAKNAWLPDGALSPARGEMIRVALVQEGPSQVVHRAGRWLRPLCDDTYQFGATYDHSAPVAQTTPEARDRLMADLSDWLTSAPSLLDQVAGVRPVARDRQAFVTTHPVHRGVHAFNGLGSHGVLIAPRLAAELADRLCD